MLFLWVKVFHIVMVTSWFAGLFYLPRIFVNIAMVPLDETNRMENNRLLLMANKLYRFMTPLGVLALATGLWLWLGYGIGQGAGWMHAKLALIVVLVIYHISCRSRLAEFNRGERPHSHVWYRWYNEIPVLILLAVVALVVIKPF